MSVRTWRILLVFFLLFATAAGALFGWRAGRRHGFKPSIDGEELYLLPDGEFYQRLAESVGKAEKEVVISTYLFISRGKPTNLADKMISLLQDTAARGITVTVILENDQRDEDLSGLNRRTGQMLSEGGVLVVFDNPRVKAHAKVAVIDRRLTFIGSHNLTDSALRYNRELSLMVSSEKMAEATLSYLSELSGRKL